MLDREEGEGTSVLDRLEQVLVVFDDRVGDLVAHRSHGDRLDLLNDRV